MKRKVKMAIQPPSFRPTIVGNRHARKTSGLGVRWIIFYKPKRGAAS